MIKGVTESLVGGVMQQKDMRLIEDGAPAYLLIVESLIFNNPENRDFLMAGIQTFSSYSLLLIMMSFQLNVFYLKITPQCHGEFGKIFCAADCINPGSSCFGKRYFVNRF